MKLLSKKSLSLTMALVFGSIHGSNAAIIAGTETSATEWSVGGLTINVTDDGSLHTMNFSSSLYVGTSLTTLNFFVRDADMTVGSSSSPLTNIVSSLTDGFFISYQNGAVSSSDNWILFDLDGDITGGFDSAAQFQFNTSSLDDAILNLWHDDSGAGANILTGVTAFSQITASSVPEPSGFMLSGLGLGVLTLRRTRKS